VRRTLFLSILTSFLFLSSNSGLADGSVLRLENNLITDAGLEGLVYHMGAHDYGVDVTVDNSIVGADVLRRLNDYKIARERKRKIGSSSSGGASGMVASPSSNGSTSPHVSLKRQPKMKENFEQED
jgi:hypothetical protein